jgi:hypothetical protein
MIFATKKQKQQESNDLTTTSYKKEPSDSTSVDDGMYK